MKHFLLLLASLAVLTACSGIETETLREKPLLLKGMKTYHWALMPEEQSDSDSANENLLMHKYFRMQVDRIMAEKGYEKRVSGADMELDYRVLILQEKRELYQANEIAAAEYGIEWRFDRDSLPSGKPQWKHEEAADIELYQAGKLVLGAIDTRSGKAIWLRSAEKPLNPEATEDERKDVLDAMAKKLLKPFPERGE